MGHYSVVVTERYAHLRADLFTATDLATLKVNMRGGAASIEAVSGAVVHDEGSASESRSQKLPMLQEKEEGKAGVAL